MSELLPPAPPPPPHRRSPLASCLFSLSLLGNGLAVLILVIFCLFVYSRTSIDPDAPLDESFYSGDKTARDKIAIIHLDGVIMEGLLNYPRKQIEQAAKDDHVKAVVFRIDSPGGSITGSDDLHHRLVELRDGNPAKGTKAKPIIVSMGSMAASGGYYVAMPAQTVYAEPSTLTGSIGVYAAFPNLTGLSKEWKFVDLVTIKEGEIKDSGSPFKEMTAHEKQVWQDMVDHAYVQFLGVVADGRKGLNKEELLKDFEVTPVNIAPERVREHAKPYQRYRADGGVYTADLALKLNLIDKIGHLDDAIKDAEQVVGGKLKAIEYEKPVSLREVFLGGQANKPASVLDPGTLRKGLTPRVWYLAPGCEAAGMLGAMEEN